MFHCVRNIWNEGCVESSALFLVVLIFRKVRKVIPS